MTISSVGTGKTYTTVALFRASIPASVVANGSPWIGEFYNEELNVPAAVNFTGITTDAANYVELRAAAGQGFADSSANPLRYGTTGARLTTSLYGGSMFTITGGQKNIKFTGLQMRHTGTFGADPVINASGGLAEAAQIDRCIIEGYSTTSGGVVRIDHSSGYISRSVIVQRNTGAACVAGLSGGAVAYSSIFACTNVGGAALALGGSYLSGTVRNCGFFGATGVSAAGRTFVTCQTNVATPPSGCTTVAYSTSTGAKFTSITDATYDFKPTSGSSLAGAGTADATFFPTDIFGTTAASPPSVGPFELGGGAPASDISGNAALGDIAAGGSMGGGTPSNVSGGAQLGDVAAGGGASTAAGGNASGNANLDDVAAGGGAAPQPGTITSSVLKFNNGTVHSNVPFEAFVSYPLTGLFVVRKTGLTSTTGAAPVISFSDGAVIPGVQYRVTWRRTDTGAEGTEILTAT